MYHKSVSCILVYNWINNRLLSFITKGYCSETILRIYLNFGGLRESGARRARISGSIRQYRLDNITLGRGYK